MYNAEIEQIYNKLVDENLKEMKEAKKKYEMESKMETKAVTCGVLLAILILPLIIISIQNKSFFLLVISILIFIVMLLYIIKYATRDKETKKYLQEYRRVLNRKAMNEIINSFEGETEFETDNGIAEKVYIDAQFEPYENYYSTSLIKKNIHNRYELNMSVVETSKTINVYDSSEISTTEHGAIFSGEFARVKVDIDDSLCIFLRNDEKDKNFLHVLVKDNLFKKLPSDKLRLKMESKEFEKLFDVYTNNKNTTLRILTEETLLMLMEIYEKYNMQYDITIKDSNIYIRVKQGFISHISFLTNFKYDKQSIYNAYETFSLIYELSNKLIDILENIKI